MVILLGKWLSGGLPKLTELGELAELAGQACLAGLAGPSHQKLILMCWKTPQLTAKSSYIYIYIMSIILQCTSYILPIDCLLIAVGLPMPMTWVKPIT